MKLVTYELNTVLTGRVRRVGAWLDSTDSTLVVDIQNAVAETYRRPGNARTQTSFQLGRCDEMLDLIEAGPDALDVARNAIAEIEERLKLSTPAELIGEHGERIVFNRDDVRLVPPLRPIDIFDVGNYEAHIVRSYEKMGLELPKVWYERPNFYRSGVTNLAGPGDPIIWPRTSEKLDYELEVAAVIGTAGKDIAVADALKHIFGYTIFNDVSARDVQASEMPLGTGPFKSKNFENSNVIGPCILTADEVEDPQDLAMWARGNGELWSEGNTSGMHKSFAQLVSFLSIDERVHPGQLIASGTPDGGCGFENGKWLSIGDVIELEVEGIGVLSNKVVAAPDPAL